MTDYHNNETPTLTGVQRAKVAFARVVAFVSGILLAMALLALFTNLPLPAGIAVWTIGAVVAHVWLFRGIVRPRGEKPGLHDLRSYVVDSGIPMIVLGWPVMTPFLFFPEFAEEQIEKLLGIRWNNGVRTFD
tara:strand:+ start:196 stop:591 length:396 start_codon:yes stop_codon:yes gene_type:complete